MPESKRVDEVGGLYDALHIGNTCAGAFHQAGDYETFTQILQGGRRRSGVDLIRIAILELA